MSEYGDKTPMVSTEQKNTTTKNVNNNKMTNTCNNLRKRLSVGNPFPKSLAKSCLQASKALESYLEEAQEQSIIPQSVLESCKGVVIVTLVKGAYMWSGRIGSGLVVERNQQDGSWSLPWAINTFGFGHGFQVGLEITDMVIILRDQDSLNSLKQKGNLSIGGNLTVALGPYGRNAEVDFPVTCALMYSLSKSKGVFVGISLEISLWFMAAQTTNKFYRKKVTFEDLLNRKVDVIPHEAVLLNNALMARFSPSSSSSSSSNSSNGQVSTSSPATGDIPTYEAATSSPSPSPLYPSVETANEKKIEK